MVDNLGFTLTPDSMISFRDAIWPMIIFSFLAFAGNTLYPVFLRLVIWAISKIVPRTSQMQEPLSFLLNHPRRCYTLLFPSRPTWILFGIIFALNLVDTLLIIVLDLKNPEVAALPTGQRLFAAIFQAASSRHTGTSTFNLANVNPAVQFSLMVMMYIAIFPIALSIRASNTYEEKSLGIWEQEGHLDEVHGRSYLMRHMQNQLNFDLWYIFLGIFCICIAEAGKIADTGEPVSHPPPSHSQSEVLILRRHSVFGPCSLKSHLPSRSPLLFPFILSHLRPSPPLGLSLCIASQLPIKDSESTYMIPPSDYFSFLLYSISNPLSNTLTVSLVEMSG